MTKLLKKRKSELLYRNHYTFVIYSSNSEYILRPKYAPGRFLFVTRNNEKRRKGQSTKLRYPCIGMKHDCYENSLIPVQIESLWRRINKNVEDNTEWLKKLIKSCVYDKQKFEKYVQVYFPEFKVEENKKFVLKLIFTSKSK